MSNYGETNRYATGRGRRAGKDRHATFDEPHGSCASTCRFSNLRHPIGYGIACHCAPDLATKTEL